MGVRGEGAGTQRTAWRGTERCGLERDGAEACIAAPKRASFEQRLTCGGKKHHHQNLTPTFKNSISMRSTLAPSGKSHLRGDSACAVQSSASCAQFNDMCRVWRFPNFLR